MNRLNEEAMQERRKPDAPGGKHSVPDQTRTGGPAQKIPEENKPPAEREKSRKELDKELNEGLEDTFPASDPPAVTSIVTPGKPPARDR